MYYLNDITIMLMLISAGMKNIIVGNSIFGES